MTEQEMREGFAQGWTVTQEEWADRAEIEMIDKLVREGVAEVVEDWEYVESFQCERRKIKGVAK